MLNEEYLLDRMKEGKLFLRVIMDPSEKEVFSKHGETNWQIELRKVARKVGTPTLTHKKNRYSKDGNPNRSTTMAAPGGKLFWSDVGYGIVNPHMDDIKGVATNMDDYNTGSGKKKGAFTTPRDENIERKVKVESQLEQLYKYMMDNPENNFVNEVVMTIRKENINFIFFTNKYAKQEAIYMQKEHEKVFGEKLPIFEYSRVAPYIKEFNWEKDKENTLAIEAAFKNESSLKKEAGNKHSSEKKEFSVFDLLSGNYQPFEMS